MVYPYQKHIPLEIPIMVEDDSIRLKGTNSASVTFKPAQSHWFNPFRLLHPRTIIKAWDWLSSGERLTISMLSSVGKCGIAEYTRTLVDSFGSNVTATIYDSPGALVEAYHHITQPGVIHIQYEPALWSSVLDRQRLSVICKLSCPKVITAHYYDDWLKRHASAFDMVIVHDQRFARHANHRYLVQGCPVFARKSKKVLRERLGIPQDAILLASFGFYMEWKRLDVLFESLAPYLAMDRRFHLVWMHSPHPKAESYGRGCIKRISRLAEVHRLGDRFHNRAEFLSTNEINDWLQASDLGVLWAKAAESTGSSAVSKSFVSGRCPVIATSISHYADLEQGVLFVPQNVPLKTFLYKALATATDWRVLDILADGQVKNYAMLNYNEIARQHLGVYMEAIYGS